MVRPRLASGDLRVLKVPMRLVLLQFRQESMYEAER